MANSLTPPAFTPADTLICVALEDELPRELLPDWQVVYTGVGKINATQAIAEAWPKHRPRVILNFGTAGATAPRIRGLVRVTEFAQRDMDVRGLGFALGETPFEDLGTIQFGEGGLSCGTGDQFVMSPPELRTDLVDMESYALAKYARSKEVDFICYKYVSDRADDNAANDWSTQVKKGARAFLDNVIMKQPAASY
ncbi:MAG: hypothetical protein MK135_14470 [Polyangiaceae bacterium]|nr:hypothetical protein [Polyangiaceae bacterium]